MTLRDERLKGIVGGKYRIVRFLAEGGMGSVYEAQHLVVKRRFAVKFLRADLARRRDVLLRFKREAAATGALEAENIAAAIDFGIAEDGAPYIVMEYLDGVDLGALLSEAGPLPVARAADLVVQACRGMQEAHAAGLVHRDLKPQNLFVCRRGDGTDLLKIVDFGVAKLLAGDATSQVTRTGSMVGTPSYMSPEQARGETDVDARADVHALGAILYELLSGRTPYRGDSFNAVIHNIATQPPMPLRCEGRELPAELERIVERALSSNPADRQASAGQLADELAVFARREVWPAPVEKRPPFEVAEDASQSGERSSVSETPPSFPGAPIDAADDRAPPARNRVRLVSLSSLLAAALFGSLWLAARSASSPSPTEKGATVGDGVLGDARTSVPPSLATPMVASAAVRSVPASQSAGIAGSLPLPVPSQRNDERTNGRTAGRPPKRGNPSPATSQPAASGRPVAAFDTRNPYD